MARDRPFFLCPEESSVFSLIVFLRASASLCSDCVSDRYCEEIVMTERARTLALVTAVLLVALAVSAQTARTRTTPRRATADQQLARRVNALLAKMTLEEKVGQLVQAGAFPGMNPEAAVKAGAGSVLWLNDPKQFNAMQRVAVNETRLKIPVLFGLDVVHGYQTIFPVPLAMAASWDPALYEKSQEVAARESRAAGLHWTFAPMLDIARDARWGRIVEGAGEDPYLGAAMAAAQVRGFQGPSLGTPDRLLACAKHFAGYGAADGGRDYDSVYIPEGQLRNVYLPPFRAAAKAGVGTFMSAYMDLNDVPAGANRFLLRDVLRKEWGFQGFVVSDAMAVGNLVIQGFAGDGRDAARRALTAGLDMDMASGNYAQHLASLVNEGLVSKADLDEAVRRVLTVKMTMGLFEHPFVDEAKVQAVLSDPAHRAQARAAAQRSLVLLRNEKNVLPLSKTPGRLAVIGPLADSKEDLEGSWVVFGHTPSAVTVLDGIKAKLDAGTTVTYASGPEIRRDFPSPFGAVTGGKPKPAQSPAEAQAAFDKAVETARGADAVVLVLGEKADMSGEAASRATLDLPGRQQELLEAVVALGKPVVLVLVNGRPLAIEWAAAHVPAILEAWQPGTEGGNAIADALFGDVNPGGKLPVTFPRRGQAPIYYAHNLTHQPENVKTQFAAASRYWDAPYKPVFPFGFGLSYTTFAYSNLKTSASLPVGRTITVSVDVENTGKVAGDEVVQLYVHQKHGSDSRPVRELKGFERVALKPGEKKTVRFTLGPEELGYWSTARAKWTQDASPFDVWAGGDSQATLHAEFSVVRQLPFEASR
jgi:beta-glucosidase